MSKAQIHHYKADGSVKTHSMKGGTKLTLEEIQGLVGGYFTVVRINHYGKDCQMILNEEGELRQLPINECISARVGYTVYGDVAVLEGYELE